MMERGDESECGEFQAVAWHLVVRWKDGSDGRWLFTWLRSRQQQQQQNTTTTTTTNTTTTNTTTKTTRVGEEGESKERGAEEGGIGAEDEFESVRAARKTRVDHVRHADGVPSKALRSGNIEGHPLPPCLQKQERHETCWNWCVAPGRRKMAVAATAIGAMEKASAKLCLSVGLISSNR